MPKLLWGFFKKEIIQLLRDPVMQIFIFLVPIIQLIIFGFAVSNEIKNIKLAAFLSPSDTAAYHIYKEALASKWFIPAKTQIDDPYKILQSNKADAVIIAPKEGLEKLIKKDQGKLQLLINATNAVKARAIENYIKTIVNKLYPPDKKAPLNFSVRVLYNPSLKTDFFMVPGVMAMIINILIVILTSMSIAREKEVGTIETIISAPIKSWQIILGKILPFIVLGYINIITVLGAARIIFNVPIRGPLVFLAVSSFGYICAIVGVAIFISTIAKNQQQAAMGSLIYNLPSILLSGLMFPIENMPIVLKGLAIINPMSHYVYLLRNIFLKGGDPSYVFNHTLILLLMATVTIFVSLKQFKATLE